MSAVSKWINILLKLVKQVQAATAERDPIAGATTKRSVPRTRAVENGVRVEYTPEMDGDADPGEVVWAWVPFEEDPNRGKDRPVVIIGRTRGDFAGVALTSKNKGRREHIPVGTGSWDPKGRDSWAKVDRLLTIDPDDVRREGAILDRNRFDDVVGNLARYHELIRS
ncbi:MAG: hypothetical protein ACJAR2_000679 [Ilumatobacter sp.]|jgi:hypothetical protein